MDLTGALTLGDVQRAAEASLDPAIWAYVEGGAGLDRTVRANEAAFEDVWLRSRVLAASSGAPDLGVSLFGRRSPTPVLLAPTSPQRLLHPEAELAVARAAAAAGAVSIVSTDTHHALPDIVRAGEGGADVWFQLYAYGERKDVEALIDLAGAAGAAALVVTVDASHAARRIWASRAGFSTPDFVDFGTLRALGLFDGAVPANGRIDRLQLGWSDLEWIRRRTPAPLLVKGVLHPADARRCVDLGADGIVVSNHGGRQLDGAAPSLMALGPIVREVGGDCVVLMDGGVRSGLDVAKALALGAKGVCIGRPYLWGLAAGGQAGVEAVLSLIRAELENILLQLGVGSAAEIGLDLLAATGWPAHPGLVQRATAPAAAETVKAGA